MSEIEKTKQEIRETLTQLFSGHDKSDFYKIYRQNQEVIYRCYGKLYDACVLDSIKEDL